MINSVFPTLVPAIAAANKLRGAIDIFNLFDGSDWRHFPARGCSLETLDKAKCDFYCSASQSWQCDQCHPDDAGYSPVASGAVQGAAPATGSARERYCHRAGCRFWAPPFAS